MGKHTMGFHSEQLGAGILEISGNHRSWDFWEAIKGHGFILI